MDRPLRHAEAEKYNSVWNLDAYSEQSPGAQYAPLFQEIAKPKRGQSVIDIGAGHGAGSRALKDMGLRVDAFDIADNEQWPHRDIPYRQGCVWDRVPFHYDFAYSCDMMEHLPEQFAGLAVRNILGAAHHCFFSVCFKEDHFGRYVRQPLHLTVKPFVWWRDLFRELGTVLEARDLIGDGVFYVAS